MNVLDALLFGYRKIFRGSEEFPGRDSIAFAGNGVSVADDPVAKRTTVTITGGGEDGGGNVSGPVSSLIGRLTIFADSTGKVIADSGHLLSDVLASIASKVGSTRTINTIAPLTGGRDLSEDIDLEISAASGSGAGSMSSAHWTKLEAIAASATNTPVSAATPEPVGTASAGSGTAVSAANHVHAHGNQAGGALHALATPSVAGFFSAADKTAHDAIAAGFRGVYAITGTTHAPALGNAGACGVYAGTAENTVTIPTNATVAYPIGTVLTCLQGSTGQLVFAPASGVALTPEHGFALRSAHPGSQVFLVKTGTNAWSVLGGLAEDLPVGQVLYEHGAVVVTTAEGYQPLFSVVPDGLAPSQTWDMAASVIAQRDGHSGFRTIDLRFAFLVAADGTFTGITDTNPIEQGSEFSIGAMVDEKDGVVTIVGYHPGDLDGSNLMWSVRVAGHGLTHGYTWVP